MCHLTKQAEKPPPSFEKSPLQVQVNIHTTLPLGWKEAPDLDPVPKQLNPLTSFTLTVEW